MKKQGEARLIASSDNGLRVCAAAARISTTDGTALQVLAKGDGSERDLKLVKKVLASGHKSLMEHHTFSIAFENVSVLVEQFLIEFRLASFTVKSRRYVNFVNAGFYVPESLNCEMKSLYESAMLERFSDYGRLLELGVPKEDARFVLPYSFLSNFYVSCNARELIQIICTMCYGRGSAFPEIHDLGLELEQQFDALYPGVIEAEKKRYEQCAAEALSVKLLPPHVVEASLSLISYPSEAENALMTALRFTRRFEENQSLDNAIKALLRDARPRELECLSYTFLVKDVSLASVTHYARHRMQSPLFEHTSKALNKGSYILPDTIRRIKEAEVIYRICFERNHHAAEQAIQFGISPQDLSYFALAGSTIDLMITMNARELLHFLKLRTCTRAQWEIRALSLSLLEQLQQRSPILFKRFGPSCTVELRCPEGRLTCGDPKFLQDEI